jgi:hypothetical protein
MSLLFHFSDQMDAINKEKDREKEKLKQLRKMVKHFYNYL